MAAQGMTGREELSQVADWRKRQERCLSNDGSTCASSDVSSNRDDSDDSEDDKWPSSCYVSETGSDTLSSIGTPRFQAATDAPGNRQVPSAEEVVIFFDWDDTLLPASHITEACTNLSASELLSMGCLRQHSQIVAATLRVARSRGRVALVTLAQRGWVHESAARFLPTLDLPKLLEELDIPIYYAHEHVPYHVASVARSANGTREMMQEGVDVLQRCKRAAMEKCLRRICRKRQMRLNVVSIGDSSIEKRALKAAMWSPTAAGLPAGEHPCKTVKLAGSPTLEQLGEQLHLLKQALPDIVAQQEDYDFTATMN